MGAKKNFILDTNVILHDYKCLENFEENDIYIPLIVIDELDRFKRGNEQLNFNARSFIRDLDAITDDSLFKEGSDLGMGRGKLFVVNLNPIHEKVKDVFPEHTADNIILSNLCAISEKFPENKTILVTKDVGLRMKARSIGILAEDYINDKVVDVNIFEGTTDLYENVDADIIDELYSHNEGIDADKFDFYKSLQPNQCFVIKSSQNSALVRYYPSINKVKRVSKDGSFGVHPRNTEQTFALNLLKDPDIKLIAITGKAGTGKTLLSLAAALDQNKEYRNILLARPIVSLSNKDIGFLPGDEKDKIRPYMQPLFDNLNVIKTLFSSGRAELVTLEEMQKSGRLEIEALAFIRGRSLSDMFCIIDEAQNLTPHEVKTIITRAGEGTKMVFTGDLQQIDSPYLDSRSNGLAYMIEKMNNQPIFAHINLLKGERSELSELASNIL